MPFKVEIPYDAYLATPFSRLRDNFSHLTSVEFAAHVCRKQVGD